MNPKKINQKNKTEKLKPLSDEELYTVACKAFQSYLYETFNVNATITIPKSEKPKRTK